VEGEDCRRVGYQHQKRKGGRRDAVSDSTKETGGGSRRGYYCSETLSPDNGLKKIRTQYWGNQEAAYRYQEKGEPKTEITGMGISWLEEAFIK